MSKIHIRRRHREAASPRLFTLEELAFATDCAFEAGRDLGWRAAEQLAVALRRYRTYLILSELQRLEQAFSVAGRAGEAAGVERAVSAIREQFSHATPEEVVAYQAGMPSCGRRPGPEKARQIVHPANRH